MLLVALYFFTIPFLPEGRDIPLYLRTDVLPENAKHIKRLPILEVPPYRSCDITTCHWSTRDNEVHHLNCFQDKCHYGSYHCLHDSRTIVHFCGTFNQCDEHTRHIAKINGPLEEDIDIYEVPCPKGYIQPNIEHSCFEPCIPDKSSAQETTKHEQLNPHSGNASIPHHDQHSKTESPYQDTTGTSKPAEVLREKGPKTETIIIVLMCIIVIIIIVATIIVVWKKKAVTKTTYTKTETTNNILTVNNPNSVTINVGDDNQSEPLLDGSDMNDNDNNVKDQNDDHTMEDLKDLERPEEMMEPIVPRPSTDSQCLHASQTQLKQPPSP